MEHISFCYLTVQELRETSGILVIVIRLFVSACARNDSRKVGAEDHTRKLYTRGVIAHRKTLQYGKQTPRKCTDVTSNVNLFVATDKT